MPIPVLTSSLFFLRSNRSKLCSDARPDAVDLPGADHVVGGAGGAGAAREGAVQPDHPPRRALQLPGRLVRARVRPHQEVPRGWAQGREAGRAAAQGRQK